MAKYEEKFIVINLKRFEELNDEYSAPWRDHPAVEKLNEALTDFTEAYESDVGKPLDQKYYVVNQDEPYADNVIKFILDNETKKEKINEDKK